MTAHHVKSKTSSPGRLLRFVCVFTSSNPTSAGRRTGKLPEDIDNNALSNGLRVLSEFFCAFVLALTLRDP